MPSSISYAGLCCLSGSGTIKPILCIKERRINAGSRFRQFIEKFCYDRLSIARGDKR